MIPSAFSIKLAALASRKKLVDLEKWLSTNLNSYKDIFFEVIYSVGLHPVVACRSAIILKSLKFLMQLTRLYCFYNK